MSAFNHQVKVGNVLIGGDSPLVLQSMTSTDTNDIQATVEQSIRIFEAGGQMVRMTTQGLKEVESLEKIKKELFLRGYDLPLIADVHFQPKVALAASKVADKVRINPGNYIPRNYEGPSQFNFPEQEKQMNIIRENLLPLIEVCRENNTAIRIGVNHGSLSKRMLSWFGNTPEGMVESAMEFIHIFHAEDFHQLVVSLKSSDSKQMIYANRLLVKRMVDEDIVYPIHLGVTEAGSEEDGRIKSSVGISTLLSEGIGDTIRVSLTEDPEAEIPVAKIISSFFIQGKETPDFIINKHLSRDPYRYKRRLTMPSDQIGGHHFPVVISKIMADCLDKDCLASLGYKLLENNTLDIASDASDFIFMGNKNNVEINDRALRIICNLKAWQEHHIFKTHFYPIIESANYSSGAESLSGLHFIKVNATDTPEDFFRKTDNEWHGILILELPEEKVLSSGHRFFRMLYELNNLLPVILYKKYHSKDKEELMIKAAGEMGALLVDGFGDGIWIDEENEDITVTEVREIAFGILQATGTRISRTEYIACPSCGRTLFDIQKSLKKIKEATRDMKGLKIGVMGCIVNGPGEMADADYGYVGAGPGKITLYKGQEPVKKNIPEEDAVEELVRLINSEK
jgi:(E)-4-hydroxy-3-methylbut-2-enyl-diphosphate synthase